MKSTKAQQKTTKSPKALFNLRRQRATQENLAKGMAPQEAMIAAGYSPLYVQHQGYKASSVRAFKACLRTRANAFWRNARCNLTNWSNPTSTG